MPITLKFTGRFLVAEQTGKVDFLALNIQKPDARHCVLMSIPSLALPPPDLGQSAPGDFRVMAGSGEARAAANVVWDLEGWDVEVQELETPLTFTKSEQVADLVQWETERRKLEGASAGPTPMLNPEHLTKTTPEVNSRIHVPSGTGLAMVACESTHYDRAIVSSRNRTASPKTTLNEGNNLVDVVEITIDEKRLTLLLTNRAKRDQKKQIVISTASAVDHHAVVWFSNLCLGARPGRPDHEFASFYTLLDDASTADYRMVPAERAGGAVSFECILLAFVDVGAVAMT